MTIIIAIWVALTITPTHHQETVRIDALRTEEAATPVPATVPVTVGRTTCIRRPRPIRPRTRYIVRVRRYRGQVATFPEIEVPRARWLTLRVDNVVEIRWLLARDDDDGWWR